MTLNEGQKKIAETIEGTMVVDAGPGTGKTGTITERYINMISRPDISPTDILMLTFTRNAAAEMETRIKDKLSEFMKKDELSAGMKKKYRDSINQVQAKTFDAFCMSIVLDSTDEISDFFKIDEKLSRSAKLVDNYILKLNYFSRFLDQFINDRGEDYGDIVKIASSYPEDLMKLISKLMSKGIVPLKKGWFGYDSSKILNGDYETLYDRFENKHNKPKSNDSTDAYNSISDLIRDGVIEEPEEGKVLSMERIGSAIEDERKELFEFIHDVYYEYIRRSITDNRLTFGLNALFAFCALYHSKSVRNRNRFRYVMIDEFQDTNANQMMISLMILEEPNLCVLGDWKQGIYGFRYVSIENILKFNEKVSELCEFLNDDFDDDDENKRVKCKVEPTEPLKLDWNYRSSQKVIDASFECLYLRGHKDDVIDREKINKNNSIVRLKQANTEIKEEDTAIRYVFADSNDEEVDRTLAAIKDYVFSKKYTIHYEDENHKPKQRSAEFGDIAVLCRGTNNCRAVFEACKSEGIPAYLEGDVQLMSTREGKLTLAWLKFVNNELNPWGYVAIMADLNYTPIEIENAVRNNRIPKELRLQRDALRAKRRRMNELLTLMFSFYNLDNDITQAIISTLSSIYNNSMMTISDIIGIIEDDIENNSTYSVENSITGGSVRIMTMHKAKGLEFPIVICPFIDSKEMPSTKGEKSTFKFNKITGIRCTKEVCHFEGYSKICPNWKTALVNAAMIKDYDEERRLMFVAMSRAKQYITLIAGPKASFFMKDLAGGNRDEIDEVDQKRPTNLGVDLIAIPKIPSYEHRVRKIGVHEILDFKGENCENSKNGKGMEYGTKIHEIAERMCKGLPITESDYPEIPYIRKILDSTADCDMKHPEINCLLPLNDMKVTLKGVVDLLVIYDDHIEIHDYKTDVSYDFESEYKVQLSIYAYAVDGFYNGNNNKKKPVKCFIDYVSLGETKEIEIVPLEEIEKRVDKYLEMQPSN